MRKNKYKIGDKVIIDLPQYDEKRCVAKVLGLRDNIYEIMLYKEVLDQDGKIKKILFLPKNLVHKNSKIQPKKRKRKPRSKKHNKLLLENPDPENIAYVHKYLEGPFAGQVRKVPISEKSKREDRVCEQCGKEFLNSHPAALRQHIFKMHTEEGKYDAWGKEAKKRWKEVKRSRNRAKGRTGTKNPLLWTSFNCTHCGQPKELKVSEYELRKRSSKSGNLYCSEKCTKEGMSLVAIRDKLLQQSIIEAEYKCQHCSYDLNFDMYFIKNQREVGYKHDLSNTIILCKNCRDLWKTGEAKVDPISKCLIMKNSEEDSDVDYSIDMDDILSQIGDVDEKFDD